MPRRPHNSPQTLAVLAALMRSSGWRYGLSLARETGLKAGTLYPLLLRLHDAGYLESEWQTPERAGRPPRHAYRLNSAGRVLAQERLSATTPVAKPA